jgi:glycosyltransferase involved in cell wall biosynthesis
MSDVASKLLSVVIPAYNVEAFIDACLRSALEQRYAEYIELIVIDDGSTDRTLERIKAIARQCRPLAITVMAQPNRGVSAARNAALAYAQAPYLGFLDSDDVWAPDFSEKIIPLLKTGDADIIEFNVAIIDSHNTQIDSLTLIEGCSVGRRDVNIAALREFVRVNQVFPSARVYRRELWNGIEFPVGRVYEDSATIPLIYTRATRLYGLPDELYRYRRRYGSITQSSTLDTVRNLTVSAEEALARCDGGPYDAYWLLVFHQQFRQACTEASRVDAASFAHARRLVNATASCYGRSIARGAGESPLRDPRWTIYMNRMVFQSKRLAKKLLRRELRPVTAEMQSISTKERSITAKELR